MDFIPGRMGKPDSGRPVARRGVTRTESRQEATFRSTGSVDAESVFLPPIRLEKVRHARRMLRDAKYPPDQLLAGIASLIAKHLH